MLYWVQIGRVQRQVEEPAVAVAPGLRGLLVTMRGEVVENSNGSGVDFGDKYLADVGGKGGAIYRVLDDPWRDQCVRGQTRNQRLRTPASEGSIHGQSLTAFGSAAQACQVCFHDCFINEDNPFQQGSNGGKLMFEPISALLPYLGAAALTRDP